MRHRRRGLRIDSLAIHFHLGEEFASHISDWIEFAFAKGVEILDLDLSESCSFKLNNEPLAEFERYTFPSSLLASPNNKGCTLKHLQLAFCNFDSLPASVSLASLTTVELRDVNITDQQLEDFLFICSSLETLSLHACTDLVKLKFSGPESRLKILSIQNCLGLRSIELGPDSLTTFEYAGELATFSFKYAPRLTDVYLSFTGQNRQEGVSSALSTLAHDIPHLRTLNLVSVLGMKTAKLPDKVLCFTNVQELILSVFPFRDEDNFDWIVYVLKAFALLRFLQLNLFSPSYIRKSNTTSPRRQLSPRRLLPECPHKYLSKLEMNGFYGSPHETELLDYLLENLVGLQVLVVNPCRKIYKRFNCWESDEEATCFSHKIRPHVVEWIHYNVPPHIQLHIL